jgi:hypothetical protein
MQRYNMDAKKYVIIPHNIFDTILICIVKNTGLYKSDIITPNQNELHSGHNSGMRI